MRRPAETMRRVGMSRAEIAAALHQANADRCAPPLARREVDRIAASVARYEPCQVATAVAEGHWQQMVETQPIRPLEDWGKLIGDVPSATAILDRFLHHAEIITITGRSYRFKDRAEKDEKADGEPTPRDGTEKA